MDGRLPNFCHPYFIMRNKRNMQNYKLTIQYDGSRYNGWQRQGNTENTIQGKLNEIIGRYLGEKIDLAGSGRTDRGVHAYGQVANFKTAKCLDKDKFLWDINSYLPQDIRIVAVESVDERFHARLSAVLKTYEYVIDNGLVSDVFARKYSYRLEEKLDVEKMRVAAELLTGTHDYLSFCGNKKFKKSSIRTVTNIIITESDGTITISFTGNGFLQNMVRIMAGTLIEVGLGKRKPESMTDILNAHSREEAGMMAPAEGLFLKEVEY